MNIISFNIYFCGMSDENFSDKIMIYKPNYSITKKYDIESLNESEIFTIGELIDYIKTDDTIKKSIGDWGMENLSHLTIYIKYKDYLLGLKEDKIVSNIFDYLNTDQLEFAYFLVGGASIHNETSYRFTVYSDEKIHEHMPHVHVSKAGKDVRYSLDTLLAMDPLTNPHKRDNRKIIAPFLKKNKFKLLEMWHHNMNGYSTPEITEEDQQFYSES